MTWFKVDDNLAFHPKVLEAGNGAMGGWVRLGSHCGNHETDGYATAKIVRAIFSPDELEAIMATGQLILHPDGRYEMHDFLKYNPSHAELEAKRAAWVAKKHPENRRVDRSSSPGASPGEAQGEAPREAPVEAREMPVGKPQGLPGSGSGSGSEDPDLDPENPEVTGIRVREFALTTDEQARVKTVRRPRRSKPQTALPDDWSPPTDENAHSWHQDARRHGLTASEVETALREFKNHYKAHGELRADWVASWRTWLGRVRQFSTGVRRQSRQGYGVHQQPAAPGEEGWKPRGLAGAK